MWGETSTWMLLLLHGDEFIPAHRLPSEHPLMLCTRPMTQVRSHVCLVLSPLVTEALG